MHGLILNVAGTGRRSSIDMRRPTRFRAQFESLEVRSLPATLLIHSAPPQNGDYFPWTSIGSPEQRSLPGDYLLQGTLSDQGDSEEFFSWTLKTSETNSLVTIVNPNPKDYEVSLNTHSDFTVAGDFDDSSGELIVNSQVTLTPNGGNSPFVDIQVNANPRVGPLPDPTFTVFVTIDAKATIQITTSNAHSPGAPAHSNSAYVGVEGTSAGIHDPIYVQSLDKSMKLISSDAVIPDAEGRWDAVVFAGSSAVEVRAVDSGDNSIVDTVYVTAKARDPAQAVTDYTKMRKGDLVVSESPDRAQKLLYGADFTHVSVYDGPDSNGTPIMSEAVLTSKALPKNFFNASRKSLLTIGDVEQLPLEQSEAFVGRIKASIYTKVGATETFRDTVASFALRQHDKPYWVDGFLDIAKMGALYPRIKKSGR
jgi:hypothetical protein